MKSCVCINPVIPGNLPSSPEEYRGTALCSGCKGIITFPIGNKKEYSGNDEVKKYLYAFSRQQPNMTIEKALLIMLLRIEEALLKKEIPKEDNRQASKLKLKGRG